MEVRSEVVSVGRLWEEEERRDEKEHKHELR